MIDLRMHRARVEPEDVDAFVPQCNFMRNIFKRENLKYINSKLATTIKNTNNKENSDALLRIVLSNSFYG